MVNENQPEKKQDETFNETFIGPEGSLPEQSPEKSENEKPGSGEQSQKNEDSGAETPDSEMSTIQMDEDASIMEALKHQEMMESDKTVVLNFDASKTIDPRTLSDEERSVWESLFKESEQSKTQFAAKEFDQTVIEPEGIMPDEDSASDETAETEIKTVNMDEDPSIMEALGNKDQENFEADKTMIIEDDPNRTMKSDLSGDQEGTHFEDPDKDDDDFSLEMDGKLISPVHGLTLKNQQVSGINDNPDINTDYEVQSVLGQGGMGTVFLARQTSLDRLLAIKVMKLPKSSGSQSINQTERESGIEQTRRNQFLSEAVVTGELDHPNIIPIHDAALTSGNEIFYTMKKVDGSPWSDVIKEKKRSENLEILLKVTDAVAFAHSKGIVHRDLKPENVMLGDYGVVMLMDWGLAMTTPKFSKSGSIFQTSTFSGSPAYMAPEMAEPSIERVGPHSDIYLLGAILFEIVAGYPPHTGDNLTLCILAARNNEIRPVDPEKEGELLDIALKAMATNKEDRYQSVEEFQQAVRAHLAHQESIALSEHAKKDLKLAEESGDYTEFAKSVFGFEQAYDLWTGNKEAETGISKAKAAYAKAALDKQDFDLGLSLLDEDDPDHAPVITQLREGQQIRDSRESRVAWMKRVAMALVAVIIVGGSLLSYLIYQGREAEKEQRILAEKATEEKEEQRILAEDNAKIAKQNEQKALAAQEEEKKQRLVAEQATEEKDKQRKIAEQNAKIAKENEEKALVAREAEKEQRILAEKAQEEEEKQRLIAEANQQKFKKQAYYSIIGLVQSDVKQNNFIRAKDKLDYIQKNYRDDFINPETQQVEYPWDFRRLLYQVNQATAVEKTNSAGREIIFSQSGNLAAATLDNGDIRILTLDDSGNINARDLNLPNRENILSAAISPDEQLLATAGKNGDIQLFDLNSGDSLAVLSGHDKQISAIEFTENGLLLTGSLDKTARLWDVNSRKNIATGYHIAAVHDVDSALTENGLMIVTAVAERYTGRAVVWDFDGSQMKRRGEFLDHVEPIETVSISQDGKLAASGDGAGHIMVWATDKIEQAKTIEKIQDAVDFIKSVNEVSVEENSIEENEDKTGSNSLVYELVEREPMQLVSTRDSKAHDGKIQTLSFSRQGHRLLSGADDHELKIWELGTDNYQLTEKLKGHGGPVSGADISPRNPNLILSTSKDGTIRSWMASANLETVNYPPAQKMELSGQPAEEKIHNDSIYSAILDQNGTRILTASRDHSGRILKIDPKTYQFTELTSLEEVDDPEDLEGTFVEGSQYVSFSMEVDLINKRLFVGGTDSRIRVWNLDSGTELDSIRGTGLNTSFALSPDGRYLLSGSSNPEFSAYLWEIGENGIHLEKPVHQIKGHSNTVTAFAISDDGTQFFTGDQKGTGIFWDLKTGKQVGDSISVNNNTRINNAKFIPGTKEILIADDNFHIIRFDTEGRQVLNRYPHNGFVTELDVSRDGRYALSISDPDKKPQELYLWDLTKGERIPLKSEDGTDEVISVSFSPVSSQAVTVHNGKSSSAPKRVKVWNMQPGQKISHLTYEFPPAMSAEKGILLPENRLITLNGNASFKWDLNTLVHELSYRSHGAVTQAGFFANEKHIVTASRSVRIWEVSSGKTLAKLEYPHGGAVYSVECNPVIENQFITGGEDGIARLWEWDEKTATIKALKEFKENSHQGPIRRVTYSKDGKHIVTVGDDGTARIRTINGENAESEPVMILTDSEAVDEDGHSNAQFLSAAISPDNRYVLVGASDGLIRMWDLQKKDSLSKPFRIFRGHTDQVVDVKFINYTANSRRIVSASIDKSVRIWDPRINSLDEENREGVELLSLRKHSKGVTSVSMNPNGDLLVTAGLDGNVILWPTRSPEEN